MLFSLHLLFLLLILMMSDFSDLFRGAEQTAGCIDVLAAAGTDSGENTMGSEVITELLHLLIVHTLQRDVGNLMEADEIETAIKPLHQFDDGLGMLHTVVHSLEDGSRGSRFESLRNHSLEYDVLETQAALMREIVVLQKLYHLFYTHSAFSRHQFCTF